MAPKKALPSKQARSTAMSVSREQEMSSLLGPVKAALWVLSVDEKLAVDILRHLDDAEIAQLADTARALGRTTPEQLAGIHIEFRKILELQPLHLKGSMEYLGRLAHEALGENKAAQFFTSEDSPEFEGRGASSTSVLNDADLDVLASLRGREHPQIIAAVLANLDEKRSSAVLGRLREEQTTDVLYRIANMKEVPAEALSTAEKILSAGLPEKATSEAEIDGVRVAAMLLNQIDTEAAANILDTIASESDDLATEIRRAMFTFEDLRAVDRRAFQTLLKEVQSDQLLLALKTASEELQEKIFSSLSKRAAAMLKDDLEVMGPARLSDVESAQQQIVSVALQLQSEGRITIAGQGSDEYV